MYVKRLFKHFILSAVDSVSTSLYSRNACTKLTNKQKKTIAFKQLSFKIKVFFNLDNIDTKKYQYYNKTKCLLTGLRRNCQQVNRKHKLRMFDKTF